LKLKHISGRELNLSFWLFGWFGYLKAPSSEFSGIWLTQRIFPAWYRFVLTVKLFVSLVFRRFDIVLLTPKLAWNVSKDLNKNPIKIKARELF
jgi:hypothetical protein